MTNLPNSPAHGNARRNGKTYRSHRTADNALNTLSRAAAKVETGFAECQSPGDVNILLMKAADLLGRDLAFDRLNHFHAAIELVAPFADEDREVAYHLALKHLNIAAEAAAKRGDMDRNHEEEVALLVIPALPRLRRAGDLVARNAPKWLIAGVLPQAGSSIMFGPSGVGKSFLALDMARCIATGLPWQGRATTPGKVVIVAVEDGLNTEDRLRGMFQHFGMAKDTPIFIVSPELDLSDDGTSARKLSERIVEDAGSGIAWIVIDTLARSFGMGDENSSTDMGRAIRNYEAIGAATGAHVTAVHHSGHEGGRERGSSALRAAMDTAMSVKADKKSGQIFLTTEKQKNGRSGLCFEYKLTEVELDGDTTAVAIQQGEVVGGSDDASDTKARKRKVLEDEERVAFEALKSAIKESGGNGVVSRDAWRKHIDPAKVSASDKPNTRVKAVTRVMDAVIKKGYAIQSADADLITLVKEASSEPVMIFGKGGDGAKMMLLDE